MANRPKAKSAATADDFSDTNVADPTVNGGKAKRTYVKKDASERAQHLTNVMSKAYSRLGKIRGISQEHAAKIGEFLSTKHSKAIANLTAGVGKAEDEFTL